MRPRPQGIELALHPRRFQNDLKMRLATEIQGDETSTRNPARNENPASRNPTQKNEIHDQIPKSHSLEGTEHFAIAARATNDAVRDWNVKTGALSWPQGLEALLGYDGSAASGRHRLLAEADSSPGSCAHRRQHPRGPRRRRRSLDGRIPISTHRWFIPGFARTRTHRPRFQRERPFASSGHSWT